MANSVANSTLKVAKAYLEGVESTRNLSKNVNTQLLEGRFNPESGSTFDFKRPLRVRSMRTSDGDISGETVSDIVTGRATGTVQDYITTWVEIDEVDEAINLGGDFLNELMLPMATETVVTLEDSFADFMMANTALLSGTPGTALTTWDHVAGAPTIMDASGVPRTSKWIIAVNPHTQTSLASNQRSLGSGGVSGSLIKTAHEEATLSENFAGIKVIASNSLSNYTTHTGADRAGTLSAAPNATYDAAKNTMTQTLAVTAFQPALQVRVGETIQVAGSSRINLSTRRTIVNGAGAPVAWTATVTEAVTLGASGEGNIVVTGPAILETTTARSGFNTVSSALANGAVVTLLGNANTLIQPNLFWHRDAFAIGSVPIKQLSAQDTFATTKDGLRMRVTQGSSFEGNSNRIRIDLHPAFAALNPFFAGQAFG